VCGVCSECVVSVCLVETGSRVTHRSLVVLRLGAQEAVDLLHGGHLDLQVRQVPHDPVQVVGDLRWTHAVLQREAAPTAFYPFTDINGHHFKFLSLPACP